MSTHRDRPLTSAEVAHETRRAEWANLDVLTLAEALYDILCECELREDVLDGSDGRPAPNTWMVIATMCRRALGVKD